jgi:hypothetical protein
MAKLPANSAIKFKGKISNVVGVEWNGIYVIRAAPHWKKKYKTTEKQLANQEKFRHANAFVNYFKQLLDMTVQKEVGQTRASSIMRGLLREAMVGNYPDYVLDYSKVPMARGTLAPAASPVATALPDGIIQFQWIDDSKSYSLDKNYSSNSSMLIAYSSRSGKMAYDLHGPARHTQSAMLQGPFEKGDEVHTWISFRSNDFMLKADSVYAGVVTM